MASELLNPEVSSHLPVFIIIASVLLGGLGFLGKKAWDAMAAFKLWIQEVVDERVPEKLNEKLYTKLPIILRAQIPEIMHEVLATRLEAHEVVEEAKVTRALNQIKDEFQSSRDAQDREVRDTTDQILKKLTNVDALLTLMQARIESHDGRLRHLETQAFIVASAPARKRRKTRK
jgi:hypothetical protein